MSMEHLVSQLFTDTPHSSHRATQTESTPSTTLPDGRYAVDVVRVIDGDTIVVRFDDGREETVRFLLIDTPEMESSRGGDQPYAQEATDFVRDRLSSGRAQVAFDEDPSPDAYDRLLMYVYDDNGLSVQEALIGNGLARVGYTFEPNTRELSTYRAIEEVAKNGQAGIWSIPGYATPAGFDESAIVTPAGIADAYTQALVAPQYSSTALSNNSRSFTSEAERLGAKIEFKPSGFGNKSYTSFSGTDISISIAFKGGTPVPVGEAQTVSYSLFRPMEPVYALGSAKPQGFVRGPRTIAGSVIFTVFDRNVMLDKFYQAYKSVDAKATDREYLTDELPPFDIHAVFMNEYGMAATLVIHGVFIASEGQVMSIEDMITENTLQYVATDLSLMRPERI